jgi:hypothetical protein
VQPERKEQRRIRIYTMSRVSSEEDRALAKRAAEREYQILSALVHPSIPQVETPIQHELGTALLFRMRKSSIRLDHLFAQKGEALGIDFKLILVRQLAEAIQNG